MIITAKQIKELKERRQRLSKMPKQQMQLDTHGQHVYVSAYLTGEEPTQKVKEILIYAQNNRTGDISVFD